MALTPHILIVDDEQTISKALSRIFCLHKFQVDIASDGKEALHTALKNKYDLILLDVILPGMNGVEVLAKLREKKPKLPVIMMTAYSNAEALKKAEELGASDAILKPFDNIENVVRRVKKHLGL
jgi:DNA-binding response OmpR family regulator